MSHDISWAASVINVVSFKVFAEALYVQLSPDVYVQDVVSPPS